MDVTPTITAGPVPGPARTTPSGPRAAWPLALWLSAALGLFFWLTGSSWLEHATGMPTLAPYAWGPAAGIAVLVYLWRARDPAFVAVEGEAPPLTPRQVAASVLALTAFAVYARLVSPPSRGDLRLLTAIHLPALTWLVIGTIALGRVHSPLERFAAVVKSIEALVTAGIYAGAAAIFGVVTLGLFSALGVTVRGVIVEPFAMAMFGLPPVLAVASVYDPDRRPSAQRFGAGLTRVFFIAARVFLPLTLLVLLAVAALLPARFANLTGSRQTLIVFNAMLFAVMLLLVGATPLHPGEIAAGLERWLRRGIVAAAVLALVASGFGLAAILVRTVHGGLTANRLTVIGWNVVNLVVLVLLLARQARCGREAWVSALHQAFGAGLVAYAAWTVFVLVDLPPIARAAHWPVAVGYPH